MNDKTLEKYYNIIENQFSTWIEQLVAMVPNLLAAILILLFFWAASFVASRLITKVMTNLKTSQVIEKLVSSLVRFVVICIGVFFALGVMELQTTVVSLLAGAGIIGIAIGFAFQDLVANFIAGVFMGIYRPFKIGDLVETSGKMGLVYKLSLRNTLIETFSGQMIIIPNKQVFENPLVNYSQTGKRRVDLLVGVTYDADLNKVIELCNEAIKGLAITDKNSTVGTYAYEFGDSSINFKVLFFIKYPGENINEAISQGVLAIKKAFDQNSISIPFPIRTLDFSLAESVNVSAEVRPTSPAEKIK